MKAGQREEFMQAAEHMLHAVGEAHQGVQRTPERFGNAMAELLKGYAMDPKSFIVQFDNVKSSSMIVESAIHMLSFCEHHLLPFVGMAHIGYIPNKESKKVLGISKLARVFDCFACRFQVQERIGEQFVDFMVENVMPDGVICVIEAQHFCMTERGVRKQDTVTMTAAIRGAFEADNVRNEFYALIQPQRMKT